MTTLNINNAEAIRDCEHLTYPVLKTWLARNGYKKTTYGSHDKARSANSYLDRDTYTQYEISSKGSDVYFCYKDFKWEDIWSRKLYELAIKGGQLYCKVDQVYMIDRDYVLSGEMI